MYTNWQKGYQIWSGTTLINITKAEKLCPKSKTYHESPKRRKHEKRIREKRCFVLSSFRVFVIKNKIRHNSSAQKRKCLTSIFSVPWTLQIILIIQGELIMAKQLWKPSDERVKGTNMYRFMNFVNEKLGKDFTGYASLYQFRERFK